MFGGLGDLMGLMKQAKAMKEKMDQFQAELGTREYEADAGAGAVVARVNGRGELLSVRIKPDIVNPAEVEMLEDLVRAAVSAAAHKCQDAVKAEMAQLTAGLNLPGLDGLLKPT